MLFKTDLADATDKLQNITVSSAPLYCLSLSITVSIVYFNPFLYTCDTHCCILQDSLQLSEKDLEVMKSKIEEDMTKVFLQFTLP
jgi:hypothetical protein